MNFNTTQRITVFSNENFRSHTSGQIEFSYTPVIGRCVKACGRDGVESKGGY